MKSTCDFKLSRIVAIFNITILTFSSKAIPFNYFADSITVGIFNLNNG